MKIEKVVQVVRRFNPEAWGGTESVVYHTACELQARGVESPVFCTDMLSVRGESHYRGLIIKRFSYVFPWFFLSREERKQMELKGGSPLSFSLFRALLSESDVSIIHCHVLRRLGGMARTVARLRGIPYVVTIHGGYFDTDCAESKKTTIPFAGKMEWGKVFGWLLGSRRTLDDADAIICVGKREFEEMRQNYPQKRVEYLPNGVDVERFRSATDDLFRRKFNIKAEQKIILCVSRIDYQKNQLLLLNAFARIANEHQDYQLILIGSVSLPEYYEEIKRRLLELGLKDRVLIIPGLAPDDPLLASAYRSADLFVLPSRHEPFGIVILEAWSAGVPVIASAVGGVIGFTQDRQNVLLFESDSKEALVHALKELILNTELRGRLVDEGSKEVQHYAWSRLVDRLIDLYTQISKS